MTYNYDYSETSEQRPHKERPNSLQWSSGMKQLLAEYLLSIFNL